MSWREDVLGAAAPGPAVSAEPLAGLLRALCWTPDGRLLLALDRLGNLCALDCTGALQNLMLRAPRAQVHTASNVAFRPLLPISTNNYTGCKG